MFGVRGDPGTLGVIGGDGGITPTVSVHADLPVAIEVVQQDVLAGELMVIGRDVVTVDGEIGITITRRLAGGITKIAEDLVVGAVLFDDIEDRFDGTCIADP